MADVSAARKFASLPELIAAVAPFLFDEVSTVKSDTLKALWDLNGFEYVRYIKILTVNRAIDYEGCNSALQNGLLAKMPQLESFTWRQMPLDPRTLRVLHESCPRIKAIHVIFDEDMGDRLFGYNVMGAEPWQLEIREKYSQPDMSMFTILEELTLHGLCQELPWWQSHIAQVLRRNADTFKRLSFSLSASTCLNYTFEHNDDAFDYFFKDLCADFGGVVAGRQFRTIAPPALPPLKIEFLSLGCGMAVYHPTWLEALTNLVHLQEVHVFNGGIYYEAEPVRMVYEDYAFDACEIAFGTFGPSRCPSLRCFTVDKYQFDVYSFLAKSAAEDPTWARKLAVFVGDMSEGFEVASLLQTIALDKLDDETQFLSPPVHFRMLEIDLQRQDLELYVCKGDSRNPNPTEEAAPSVEEVLGYLADDDNSTLEGLTVHLEETRESDTFGELGYTIGIEFVNLDLLATSLAKLTNLSQLAIQSYGEPFEESILSEKKLKDAAVLLAEAVPSLRYIKVCQLCWRIWRMRCMGTDGDSDDARKETVQLEMLQDREITDVELFSHTIWEVELEL
ncbi:hypothetical protein SBRCBS47491_009420 [Sporothrix bragantina]|uniref:Uncharacterized protein n=1 Tax=Sporothrix bragantina TaxID=671064 RepID=A0ABP0CUU4_9PEZI